MTRDGWRIGAVVLARLDSSRLPGKGLVPVAGRPMLAYVTERAAAAAGVDRVIVATSQRPVDDPLEAFAAERGLGLFRGDLIDVAGRALACARAFSLDAFARVNGDSPLLDFELLARAVAEFRAGDADLVTNVLRRTYPPGMSVEVVSTAAMAMAHARMTEPRHFEHVTKFFYEHPGDFGIVSIESGREGWDRVHAAVDTPEDMECFRRVVEGMPDGHLRHCGEEVVEMLRRARGPQGAETGRES